MYKNNDCTKHYFCFTEYHRLCRPHASLWMGWFSVTPPSTLSPATLVICMRCHGSRKMPSTKLYMWTCSIMCQEQGQRHTFRDTIEKRSLEMDRLLYMFSAMKSTPRKQPSNSLHNWSEIAWKLSTIGNYQLLEIINYWKWSNIRYSSIIGNS